MQYIMQQEEHHKMVNFRDEYLVFLKEYKIDFNNEYVFDFLD